MFTDGFSRAGRVAVHTLLGVVAVVSLVAARPRGVERPRIVDAPPADRFSAAEPARIRTTHLSLDLAVDFDRRVIGGTATHTVVNFTETREFVVDTRGLEIDAVTIDGAPTTWRYRTANEWTRPLEIDIDPTTHTVAIDYRTTEVADGLYWLTAKQTRGDVAPFLFTENEPIDARSWIPLQDTPGVRFTYDATVRVPPGLIALMSAAGNAVEANETGVYDFRMEHPIAPYLIALAVGRLAFHPFDDRTGVYAEPEMLDDVIWEMQFLPELVDAAEEVLGPYPFDRYDLLFPPGFVAGGMENPNLNFLSAGLILGNHEWPVPPSSYVAHELAHSWFGDLVTCATWEDTWLNEGFATYYEKRFYEAMELDERAELGYYWDREAYESALQWLTDDASVLHRTFAPGVGPGSVFNVVSYQKGGIFLETLNDTIGRSSFDAFIATYLVRNRYHWVDADEFLASLDVSVLEDDPQLETKLQLDAWIYGPGLPGNVTAPTSSAIETRVAAQATAFRRGTPASSLDTDGWGTLELVIFLPMIRDLMPARMSELDAAFGFSLMNTPPVMWLTVTAVTMYAPGMPALERFLATGVPNVVGIYQQLAQTPSGIAWARDFYEGVRDDYPPNIQFQVDRALYGYSLADAA